MPTRKRKRPTNSPAQRRSATGPARAKVVDDAQLTKRPDRAAWIEKLDRMANRPFLEGDYIPGPVPGTDIKDRAPKHPKP